MEYPKDPKQEIKKLEQMLEQNDLEIPEYQRPYKWNATHVVKLLDDIFEHVMTKEKQYRIGSVIVHEHEKDKKLYIVDGLQRLTTISILLFCLDKKDTLLLNQEYKHKISKDNIVYNKNVIENWLSKFQEKTIFLEKIKEKCEFVLFTVYDEDEAFQLFDSQNSRGKALEPFDLLKAFHLREMENESETAKANAVATWEKNIDAGLLNPILSDHLFRIRKWSKNEAVYNFTKNEIDEFKGISLHKKQEFPFESALRMLDGFVENCQNDKFLQNHHLAQSYPFSITMPIINGKRFFEYVDFYVQQKQKMFSEKNHSFYTFYNKYAKSDGHWRSGDSKVRNLYDNVLLMYFDKFGEHDFEAFHQTFYKAVFSIRCNNKSIRLETILNSNERHLLKEINDATNPDSLKTHHYKNYDVIKADSELAKYVVFIQQAINSNFK